MINHLPLRDGIGTLTTMRSRRDGDVVTITYRRGYESRRAAAVVARRYAADTLRNVRAAFIDSEVGEGVVTYVYRLVDPLARLKAQLSEDIQNR